MNIVERAEQWRTERLASIVEKLRELEKETEDGDELACIELEKAYSDNEKIFHDNNHNLRRWVCKQPLIIDSGDQSVNVIPNDGNIHTLAKVIMVNDMIVRLLNKLGMEHHNKYPPSAGNTFFRQALSCAERTNEKENTK